MIGTTLFFKILAAFICVEFSSSLNPGNIAVNVCFARDDENNCAYFKQCNSTQNIITPFVGSAPCLEASGDGLIAVQNKPPFLVINFNLTRLQPVPENNDTGLCECTVCSKSCGNYFTNTRCKKGCSTEEENSLLSYDSILPISSGKGGLCVSNANATKCLGIVLCDIVVDFLGIPVPLVDLLPICFDVSTFTSSVSLGPGIFTLNIPNSFNQTSPQGDCPCTACSGPCADNPLVGCPNRNNQSEHHCN